jgi:hypothetical protein
MKSKIATKNRVMIAIIKEKNTGERMMFEIDSHTNCKEMVYHTDASKSCPELT